MDEFDRKYPDTLYCDACDSPVFGDDIVYRAEGRWLCRECLEEYIADNYLTYELADALDIPYCSAADALQQY